MFLYDPQMSLSALAKAVSLSVVPTVLSRASFWLLFTFQFTVWYFKDTEIEDPDSSCNLSWDTIHVAVAMSTFFLAFYANLVFRRYCSVYKGVRFLFTAALHYVWELKMHCRFQERRWMHLATRYVAAALVLFLHTPELQREKVSEQEWEKLEALRLLMPSEVETLRPLIRQQAGTVALHWAARVTNRFGTQAGMTSNMVRSLVHRILQIRLQQQTVLDTVGLLVPFPYFHLLNLVLLVKLVFLAYGCALMNSAFAPVAYFFAQLVFGGTMELNAHLATPFGAGETDFPMRTWLADFVVDASVLVQSKSSPDEFDDEIFQKMGQRGRGFPAIVVEDSLAPAAPTQRLRDLKSSSSLYSAAYVDDDDEDD